MQHSKTIVLIHGLFVNDHTWAPWKTYLEEKGYRVLAPSNPGHQGIPAELRQQHHPDLARTGFREMVQNISDLVDSLPEKPLLIGHSMAGLVVQKLVEQGKATAGVSIAGAPPKNVMAPFSTVRIVWPVVNLFARNRVFMGSEKWYNRAFFNTLSEAEQQEAYERFAVPESRKITRDPLLKSFANVDFKRPHAPLLFIGGSSDNIFPTSLTRKIANRYKDSASRVDVRIFEGRSHFTCGERDWEQIAQYILDWYEGL